MLDHVLTDAIGALRDALEGAFLERQAFEERFQADVLLGDVTWETSYAVPGEGLPARVQADISLGWPTWSQTAYRTWYLEESFTDAPRIEVEVVFRVQRLTALPDPMVIVAALPDEEPSIGTESVERIGPTLETVFGPLLDVESHAVEISYQTSVELDEATLEDGSALDSRFGAIGGWVTSTLVRLGDLPLTFHPADDDRG